VFTLVVAASDSPNSAGADYVCDGVDDQVEIQAAIDELEAHGGGTVDLRAGTFYVSQTILMQRQTTLRGAGHATQLYLADGGDCDVISNLGGPNSWRAGVTIRDLRIYGNKANQSSGDGIDRSGEYAVYEGLWIEDCYGRGISHAWGDHTRIVSNVIRDCDGKGVFLRESAWATIAGNSVFHSGVSLESNEGMAISLFQGSDNAIDSNYVEGGGANRQIGAWDSPNVEITNNTCIDGLHMGIAPHSQYARIVDNVVRNSGENAIDLCGEDDNWVEGNIVSGVTRAPEDGSFREHSGICVNSSRSSIINNYVEFAGRAGIYIGNSRDHYDNSIINNVVRNSGQDHLGSVAQSGIWVQAYTDHVLAGTIIRENTCFDDQEVPTQLYGIALSASPGGYIDQVVIEGNDLRGNAIDGINEYDSAGLRDDLIRDNLR
jgi:hypothetical protein